MTSVAGLLLAAGAGRRMGGPKSLLHDADGTSWLTRSIAALEEGGCDGVTVVLGAEAERATALLTGHGFTGDVVVTADWDEGMAASLRAGLGHLGTTSATVALVTLVDLPDVGGDVVARLVARVSEGPEGAAVPAARLERAAYGGVPGHPVVLGREHWAGVASAAAGDRGARDYLSAREVVLVECGDLATGADVDTRGETSPVRPSGRPQEVGDRP